MELSKRMQECIDLWNDAGILFDPIILDWLPDVLQLEAERDVLIRAGIAANERAEKYRHRCQEEENRRSNAG